MTPLSDEDVLARFRRQGALLEGHFRLSSGLHSSVYFQSALLLQHPVQAEELARELAERVRAAIAHGAMAPASPARPTVVVSPAIGGLVLGHELGRALGVRAIFAEREQGMMTLRRGFRVEAGETVVVCEDVITTGGSAGEVAALVRGQGGRVAAVAALVNRGEGEPELGAPVIALARLAARASAPESCPLCAVGEPLLKPGSRGTNPVPVK